MTDLFPALVFDVETNDMPDFDLPADDLKQARIASIGLVLLDEDPAKDESWTSKVYPEDWVMREGAQAVNHLTDKELREEGLRIELVMRIFGQYAERAKVLASYGMRFDTKLIRGERRRLGFSDGFGEMPEVCLYLTAKPYFPKPHTQENAVKALLGREAEKPHVALPDANDAAALYRYLAGKGAVKPVKRESKVVA